MTATLTASSTRAAELRERLKSKIMVADGAMGTMLYSKGIFINRCFDELNVSSPQLVKGIHQEYVRAGAEILETNTFGSNRVRLGAFGLVEKLRAINDAGVRLAREAAGEHAFVAGALGPLGTNIEPLGPMSFAEARSIFREQADALVGAGIDLIVLETFFDLNELREAVYAAREAAGPDMVIVAQLTVEDDGSLRGGASTETFTKTMNEWPVDVIGVNCSAGNWLPASLSRSLKSFRRGVSMRRKRSPVPVSVRRTALTASMYRTVHAPARDSARKSPAS